MKVRKAIFPIAGLGTRFLPATKALPKEMLPVVDKPLIQYAVEEAYAAGIRQMIFVTGRTKRAVEDHFDTAYELETELQLQEKSDFLSLVQSIKPRDMECIYIRQSRALGLGHAILCAQNIIDEEPFAVLLADDLFMGPSPVLTQILEQFNHYQSSIVAVQTISQEDTFLYGIISGDVIDTRTTVVKHIVEKPAPDVAPSNTAVAGRYIFTPAIFEEIAKQSSGVNGEIQLTDAMFSLLSREKLYAYHFEGKRYDCGTKLGLLKATIDLAEQHPDIGPSLRRWLREKTTNNRSQLLFKQENKKKDCMIT